MILAIDTSSEACSVALQMPSGDILHRYAHKPRQHGDLILPWVDELLIEAAIGRGQLTAISVSRGPGSFTSLRIGFSLALSMAYALDIPVYAVSSLKCLAQSVLRKNAEALQADIIISTLDARMDEIYLASYQVNSKQLEHTSDERLLHPQEFMPPAGTEAIGIVGNGQVAMGGVLKSVLVEHVPLECLHFYTDYWPEARDQFALLEAIEPVAATDAELVYLRNNVAKKTIER